ncbi:single-stranded DNA-binding protein [Actinomyces sp.]|uniref:single-stranded DNA-binding protein n=1 Tax=Actinomyces sp. TaxID=29317 RepID=UPI0028A19BE5|nr:single-stranded DNA-binding protein [Actinomyces sp.]
MTGNTSITLRGRIGTDLRRFDTRNRQVIVRFRLAVSQYRIRDNGTFEERDAQWYTVRAWDRLAQNALASLAKGDPVIVVGRPTVNAWKDEHGEARGELVITAQSIGHDMNLGQTRFARTGALSSTRPTDPVAQDPGSEGATPAGEGVAPDAGSAPVASSGDDEGVGPGLEGPDSGLPARQSSWGQDGADEGDHSGVGPDGVLNDDVEAPGSASGVSDEEEERSVYA